jgi:two-component system chemotaxis response regulator CheY
LEIITTESEPSFAQFLGSIQEAPASWMCIHVQMATLNKGILDKEGVSQKTLHKIRQISIKLAEQMYEGELNKLTGKIFVFEDGDIFALFSCADGDRQKIVDTLGKEFASRGLGSLFNPYSMKDKLQGLVELSQKKVESAKEFQSKQQAAVTVETILEMTEPDRELQIALQTKRKHHHQTVILIIEDDLVTRGIIAATFKTGYKVVQEKDAKSGIAAYVEHAPNVVFLDIHLPDHNGKIVLDRLKFIDPSAYIVMISGDSVADNVLTAHSKGAAGFIKKPFTKEKIVEYVKHRR